MALPRSCRCPGDSTDWDGAVGVAFAPEPTTCYLARPSPRTAGENQDPRVDETSSPTVPSEGGGTGEWELETSWSADDDRDAGEMTACGYTVRVTAVDNTIVGNSYHGQRTSGFAGFCLLPEGTEVTEPNGGGDGSDGEG